jgi:small subunit ribosomal protein S4
VTCPIIWKSTIHKMTATFVRVPSLGDVPYPVQMEPNLVVEFYAKN